MSESAAETVYWNKLQVALSALGFAALLYTIYLTYRATKAAFESNEIARETARQELRAYIAIDSISILNFAEGEIPVSECVLKNFGQTPAYNYRTNGGIFMLERYSEHVIDYYITFFAREIHSGKRNNGVIGPGAVNISRIGDNVKISTEEWWGLSFGGYRAYVFGRVDYTDAFDSERFLTYVVNGDWAHSDKSNPICRMHLYERGNNAN